MLLIDDQMNISLTRGDCVDIHITVTDSTGANYDYSGDQDMVFSLRKEYAEPPVMDEPAPLLTKNIPLNTGNLNFAVSDTVGLDSGDYFYDIYLTTAGGYICTFIANKRFTVLPEVHGWS